MVECCRGMLTLVCLPHTSILRLPVAAIAPLPSPLATWFDSDQEPSVSPIISPCDATKKRQGSSTEEEEENRCPARKKDKKDQQQPWRRQSPFTFFPDMAVAREVAGGERSAPLPEPNYCRAACVLMLTEFGRLCRSDSLDKLKVLYFM